MLTKEDLRFNLRELSFYSTINIIPLQLNTKLCTFTIQKLLWRRILSRLQLCFFVAQVANANYTLFQSLLYSEYFVLHHFVFHLTLALASSGSLIWYFVYWIQWPNETVMLFNYSFPSGVGNGTICHRRSVQSLSAQALAVTLGSMTSIVTWKLRDSGLSKDGSKMGAHNGRTKLMWLALLMPGIGACAFCFVIAIFLNEPSLRALRFYGKTDTSWIGYAVVLCQSGYFALYTLSSLISVAEMQLLFFEKIMGKLHNLAGR